MCPEHRRPASSPSMHTMKWLATFLLPAVHLDFFAIRQVRILSWLFLMQPRKLWALTAVQSLSGLRMMQSATTAFFGAHQAGSQGLRCLELSQEIRSRLRSTGPEL